MANFQKSLSYFDSAQNHYGPYSSYAGRQLGALGANPYADAPNRANIDVFFTNALQQDALIHPSTLLSETLTYFGFDKQPFTSIQLSDINTVVQTLNLIDFLYAMQEVVNISNDGGWLSPKQNSELSRVLLNTAGTVQDCINRMNTILQGLDNSSDSTNVSGNTGNANTTSAVPAINPIIVYIQKDLLKYNAQSKPTVSLNDRDVLESVIAKFDLGASSAQKLLLSKAAMYKGLSGFQIAQGLISIVNYAIASKQIAKSDADAIAIKYPLLQLDAISKKTLANLIQDLRSTFGWTTGTRLGVGVGVGVTSLAGVLGYLKWKTGDFLGRQNPLEDEEYEEDDEEYDDDEYLGDDNDEYEDEE
jgi:hypothetical protein